MKLLASVRHAIKKWVCWVTIVVIAMENTAKYIDYLKSTNVKLIS
jgi:hypothetical protein